MCNQSPVKPLPRKASAQEAGNEPFLRPKWTVDPSVSVTMRRTLRYNKVLTATSIQEK
jgi:hypothetical protein